MGAWTSTFTIGISNRFMQMNAYPNQPSVSALPTVKGYTLIL